MQRVEVEGDFLVRMRGTERLDRRGDRVRGHDDLDPVLVDALLLPHLADGRVGALSGEEGAGPLRVPGAPLVVADDAAARGEDRVARRVQRLLGDEVGELEEVAQGPGCSTLSICARWSLPE